MKRSTRKSIPPERFINERHVTDRDSSTSEPPKCNMFSKLPLELREMIYKNSAQGDLLNLMKTDKSSYEAAHPQLYKTGTFHLKFGEDEQRRDLALSLSWSAIQHLHFHIHATEPKANPRVQKRLICYDGGELALTWDFGGSNPARALCEITLDSGCICIRHVPGVILSIIAMLSGFEKLVLKIEYIQIWDDRDLVRVLRVPEPSFGQGNTLGIHGQEKLYIIFFPLRHQTEEVFDGSYERSILAAWTAMWNRNSI